MSFYRVNVTVSLVDNVHVLVLKLPKLLVRLVDISLLADATIVAATATGGVAVPSTCRPVAPVTITIRAGIAVAMVATRIVASAVVGATAIAAVGCGTVDTVLTRGVTALGLAGGRFVSRLAAASSQLVPSAIAAAAIVPHVVIIAVAVDTPVGTVTILVAGVGLGGIRFVLRVVRSPGLHQRGRPKDPGTWR